MMLCTVSTVGARFFSARDRDMTYLWRRAYSRAEIVYRSALRRIGSVVDFAVTDPLGTTGLLEPGAPAREAISNCRRDDGEFDVDGKIARNSLDYRMDGDGS